MPSTVRWTYKGEKVEHHGEQRIELDLNTQLREPLLDVCKHRNRVVLEQLI